MTTETKKPLSLTEVKAAIKANLGTPQNNANAAKALAGTTFYAENLKGEFVLGTILPELSSKGKVQAVLACCHEEDGVPCTNTHTRSVASSVGRDMRESCSRTFARTDSRSSSWASRSHVSM
jgi:hypothetical protein